MLDKLSTFTNNHVDVLLSVSRYKIDQRLLKEDIFKVVTPDKITILKEITHNIQVFNSIFFDDIKNA